MMRILKDYKVRKKEILAAAQELFLQKGYEETSVANILEKVGVSKGTFYYYFASKNELLDALAEEQAYRHREEWSKINENRDLNAVAKLNEIFEFSSTIKADNRELTLLFLKVYYQEDNFRLRKRMFSKIMDIAGPELRKIVRQGVKEGLFHTPYPDEAIRMIFALAENLATEIAPVFLASLADRSKLDIVKRQYDLYENTIERILGTPEGSMHLIDRAGIEKFLPD
jgi:AcrR family transcriptional regulator